MKQIDQIIHLTSSLEVLKSILCNGIYTSYARENFYGEDILIPMISFSNILFRDIGENEVINYGNYGIVFQREDAIKSFDLNPVNYIRSRTPLEYTYYQDFINSVAACTIPYVHEFYERDKKNLDFSEAIRLKPLNEELKNMFDSMKGVHNGNFIQSLESLFRIYFDNSMRRVLLLKPYIVETKDKKERIAYNEREWRKSFFESQFIKSTEPSGESNPEYKKWINTPKPHFTDKYVLKFNFSQISNIIVKNEDEIDELKKFCREELDEKIKSVKTLQQLVQEESET